MDLTTIENAITAWVKSGSGLGTGQVIWADQEGPRPTGSFIELLMLDIGQVGHDWTDIEDNPTPSAGAEILHKVRGQREVTLRMQAFNGAAKGVSSSKALLNACIASSRLPSVRDALSTALVGLGTFGRVQSLSGVVGETEFEPRAVLDVTLTVPNEVFETGTYIEFVELENVSDGDPGVSTYVPSDPT